MFRIIFITIIILIVFRKQLFGTVAKITTGGFSNLLQNQIIRNDSVGLGHFGASRGNRSHDGIDLIVSPGETIFAPANGTFTRIANPGQNYPNYTGLLFTTDSGLEIKIFYAQPVLNVGDYVFAATPIAIAQKLSDQLPGALDHIHVEVRNALGILINPATLFNINQAA